MIGELGTAAHIVSGATAVLALGMGLLVAHRIRAERRHDAECRAAQAALRASDDRLRLALAATSEIVWDWDVVVDSIYHPSWASTYGFPEERTPRTSVEFVPFLHPEDVPRFQEEMDRAVEGRSDVFELEHRALTGSGEWRWMLARARVVARDAAGRATRMVGTCTDIGERKRMMAQLQIADRMASIGTLAAGVVHEVNTPLACVLANIGCCQELLEEVGGRVAARAELGDAVRKCLEALNDAQVGAARMRDILRDMRSFSRMEDEGRSPVQVGAALRAALTLANHEMRLRGRLVLDLPPVPAVLASESRLSQVFLNLLVNAAQSIPEGRAEHHEIRVTARQAEDGRVEVAVRDTGRGIPSEHLGRIFDPFFTTKGAEGGTGLGLSICHGIVAALGGAIEVESEVGRGTTVKVTLPAAPAEDGLAALAVTPIGVRGPVVEHVQLAGCRVQPAEPGTFAGPSEAPGRARQPREPIP